MCSRGREAKREAMVSATGTRWSSVVLHVEEIRERGAAERALVITSITSDTFSYSPWISVLMKALRGGLQSISCCSDHECQDAEHEVQQIKLEMFSVSSC
ncbi:hypothetical protein DPEC_G00255090 [Dallia pectoralis]|uniref:Uncharacterized protein n=1 Tax=Dallia pectoralis TaxID=75939 RepID=A0ACC2FU71_DALPE|nr:hypothetical protein DPEC_G00255090 [Dallia pectoralis]